MNPGICGLVPDPKCLAAIWTALDTSSDIIHAVASMPKVFVELVNRDKSHEAGRAFGC